MKTNQPSITPAGHTAARRSKFAALAALAVLVPVMSASRTHAQASQPSASVGWLSASPTVVQAGTKPKLEWGITYPATVKDHVEIEGKGTVKAKKKLTVNVRVLGAGVTVSNSDGSYMAFVRTKGSISYNGGSWTTIFDGKNPDVRPDRIVYNATVDKDKSLRFGGRYYYNSNWSEFLYSNMGNNNVRALANGDTPPTAYPMHTAPTLEEFIRPYLDGEGRVKIGPMDIIVLMELTHRDSQANQLGYDLQDLVLLVTFKEI
ncbi:MAG: hypothetical protein V4733_04925 [Verrucomicrobiota bacterium]